MLTLAPLPVGCRYVVPGSRSFGRTGFCRLSHLPYQKRQTDTFRTYFFFYLTHTPPRATSREIIGKRVWYIPSDISLTVGSFPSPSLSLSCLLSLSFFFFFFSRNPFVAGDVVYMMIERKGKGNNYFGNSTRCEKKKVNKLTCSNPIRTFREFKGIKCGNKKEGTTTAITDLCFFPHAEKEMTTKRNKRAERKKKRWPPENPI